MTEFEALLQTHFVPLQRYIRYKIANLHDAEDIMQEVCMTASEKFPTLKDRAALKAWLIGIAGHKCMDYYRRKANLMEIPLDALSESSLRVGRCGITEQSAVRETLDALGDREKQILYLYYFKNLPQDDIAARLSIPVGTVKSRLHYAKEKFKEQYPYKPRTEGETNMMKLPDYLPEYKIERKETEPFTVHHEELPGMFIIPRIGEEITFAMYEMPARVQNGKYHLRVNGTIELHGVSGVSIQSEYRDASETVTSTVFAQLTDTHCKYLGGISYDGNGNQKYTTFLDSDFEEDYGIGEDNCGFPVCRHAEGVITESLGGLHFSSEHDVSDIVGCYTVTINQKRYETVRLIDYQNGSSGGMLCEHYLDPNGRTILWRRFNKNDWAFSRYGKLWTELLPDNERLTVNGETYVHWYDCVTDYIF